jgi:hypothetical protein
MVFAKLWGSKRTPLRTLNKDPGIRISGLKIFFRVKALVTHDIFAHNIAIKIYFDNFK